MVRTDKLHLAENAPPLPKTKRASSGAAAFNKGQPSKWPKYNGRSHILSLDGTPQAVDSASIIKPLSTQLPTSQDPAAPSARYALYGPPGSRSEKDEITGKGTVKGARGWENTRNEEGKKR